MGLIESWGTGLKNTRRAAQEYHLPEPEFIEIAETFRVNLYRRPAIKKQDHVGEGADEPYSIGKTSAKQSYGIGDASAEQQVILGLLADNSKLTGSELAKKVGISKRNIESNMKKLKKKGLLVHHGSPKSGYWEILRK